MSYKLIGILISLWFLTSKSYSEDYYLPINSYDRTELSLIHLTNIGTFGKMRKARPGIPAHLHTGIDIKRPSKNYINEAILSVGKGMVISVRDDGPYAQIIIEHSYNNMLFWTVYEHISGIKIEVGDLVDENTVIARFMNKMELNKFGWQFDHFHFEILKVPPKKIKAGKTLPQHHFTTFNIVCYTFEDLRKYYYDPLVFLDDLLN